MVDGWLGSGWVNQTGSSTIAGVQRGVAESVFRTEAEEYVKVVCGGFLVD